jgi:hypothetical protein
MSWESHATFSHTAARVSDDIAGRFQVRNTLVWGVKTPAMEDKVSTARLELLTDLTSSLFP